MSEPKITIEDIQASLDYAKNASGNVLLRPVNEYGFIEIKANYMQKAFDDLLLKFRLAAMGVDELSSSDKLLFMLLKTHVERNKSCREFTRSKI